jgi:hypothetical protein
VAATDTANPEIQIFFKAHNYNIDNNNMVQSAITSQVLILKLTYHRYQEGLSHFPQKPAF